MTEGNKAPVFFDPRGRRRKVFSALCWVGGIALAFLLTIFVTSVMETPDLPPLQATYSVSKLRPAAMLSVPISKLTALNLGHDRSVSAAQSMADRYAFFNHWDESSFASLRENAGKLDVLVPEWLHLSGHAGDIKQDDRIREGHVRLWLKKTARHLKVLPLINNYDAVTKRWDAANVAQLLASAEARAKLSQNLLAYVRDGGFAGITVDFKSLPDASAPLYLEFVGELRALFAAAELEVNTVLPAYERRIDIVDLAEVSDKVILLAYDDHWEGEDAGPLAAQGWFEAELDEAFGQVAGEKLVVAFGSYAIDWTESGTSRRMPVSAAWDTVAEAGAQIQFDEPALNTTFSYQDGSNRRHTVWILDGVSAFNQIGAALAMGPAGVALWRLGTEDPTVWHTFARGQVPNAGSAKALEVVEPSGEVVYKGDGEVLKAADRVTTGKRTFEYNAEHNLITDQEMPQLPRSLTITRWGHSSEKLIALTFDDGPSRTFTPEILKVLKEKDAKATFFVLGANAALEPDILRDVYNGGHDIGNHTFTHPNLAEIPAAQLDLELNATQRVLESKIGVRTVLFRPPFVKDIEPETRDQARTLLASAAMGYITIGLKIDPLDWAQPGADEIVKRTIDYAMTGRGNVVLLHDAGGDRSQTVEALPRLIDELRARGFRLVTVSELLGLSRNEIMPPLAEDGRYVSLINDVGFSLARHFNMALALVFVIGIAVGVARLLLVAAAAWIQSRKELARATVAWTPRSIAVVVPAYNEEKVIVDSVSSLLESNDVTFEILVVDDGSTDRTVEIVRQAFAADPRVKLLVKPNGGKASALNLALASTDAEIIVAIDADTRLDPDAISLLVRHFGDPSVGAVAGAIHVANPGGLLTRFQSLEYVTSQNLDRRALELANGIIVVPGAIGAWRRSAVLAVGGYDTDTLAEDADLTLKLECADWKVLSEPRAFAMTEAPDTINQFLKQRFRWMFGTLQVAFKHVMNIRNVKAAGVKYFALPNILICQFLFALISPVIDLALVLRLTGDLWDFATRGTFNLSGGSSSILVYWLAFQALELAVAIMAFRLDRRGADWSLLPLIVVQRFCYRQLIYVVAVRAMMAAIRGSMMGWGKLQRRGFAKPAAKAEIEASKLAGMSEPPRLIAAE